MRLSLIAKVSVLTVLFFLTGSQSVLAQNAKNDWNSVQTLKPDSTLVVKTKTKQKISGKVRLVTPDLLTLLAGSPGQEVSIKREDVAEIRKQSVGYTAGMAGLLGGLGAGGGFAIGYGIGEAKDSRFRPEYPTAAFGAAVGVVVGVLIGNRGQVIYKAR